ncbi:hypothetical protein KDL45_16390, partial [bacterium]|nr:hypothetical protein [bacterium]
LKFYASVRLDIRRIAQIKTGQDVIGGRTRVKVVKNKVAPPFKQVEFDLIYGEGISIEGELVDMGVEKGMVEKLGTWYSVGETRIGQGRENAKQFLRENPDIREQLIGDVMEAYMPQEVPPDDESDDDTADGDPESDEGVA